MHKEKEKKMDNNTLYLKYSTDRKELRKTIESMSAKDKEDKIFSLINDYFMDVNNSTPRESATLSAAGFNKLEGKLGYDGVKKIDGNKIFAEVKPKNYSRTSKKPVRLNLQGNYTDFTWRKLEKYRDDNPIVLLSGFVDGHLVYVVQINFNNKPFYEKLKERLEKVLPTGDLPNKYCRSASWSSANIKLEEAKIIYFKEIYNIEKYVSKKLLTWLKENSQPQP